MIKLNRQGESLETAIEKIEQKIKELKEKAEAIENKAGDEDRGFTTSEKNDTTN
jgi:prefoldin subunit 5